MKALVAVCVILCLLIASFVAEIVILERLTVQMTLRLDAVRVRVAEGESSDSTVSDVLQTWEKVKPWLLVLSNHKDVDTISKSILSMQQRLYYGETTAALQEISMAKFLLRDMPEKARLTPVNIF